MTHQSPNIDIEPGPVASESNDILGTHEENTGMEKSQDHSTEWRSSQEIAETPNETEEVSFQYLKGFRLHLVTAASAHCFILPIDMVLIPY
jgi:hypothetical protein